MRRKRYTKPDISVINIDNEISLIMTTSETDPPDLPDGAAQQSGESSPTQQNNFNDNPFGE